MLDLGLAALSHANRHSIYHDPINEKRECLSVIQAAHAAEIIIKARISQDNPLAIFKNKVKIPEDITIEKLFEEERTIQWSELPKILKEISGISVPDEDCFKKFGYLRNWIQHFGNIPQEIDASFEARKFIYSVIDPFINTCWGLCAVDFDEDYDSAENLPEILINSQILFIPSHNIIEYEKYWSVNWSEFDVDYSKEMLSRLETIKTKIKEVTNNE